MPDNEVNMIMKFDENLFELFWETYGNNIKLNKDFIKRVFLSLDLRYKQLIGDSTVSDALLKNIGIFDMVNYICAEHIFHLSLFPKEPQELENDNEYFNQLINICLDKLVINELRGVDPRAVISKYSVETSVLTMAFESSMIFSPLSSWFWFEQPANNNGINKQYKYFLFMQIFYLRIQFDTIEKAWAKKRDLQLEPNYR